MSTVLWSVSEGAEREFTFTLLNPAEHAGGQRSRLKILRRDATFCIFSQWADKKCSHGVSRALDTSQRKLWTEVTASPTEEQKSVCFALHYMSEQDIQTAHIQKSTAQANKKKAPKRKMAGP